MVKYYVYFYKDGQEACHCFENEKVQAEHFAKLMGGRIVAE